MERGGGSRRWERRGARSTDHTRPCPADDAIDVLEASAAIGVGDRRGEAAAPKVDAEFFQAFDDDLDESDMRGPQPPPQQQQQQQ